MNLIGLELSDAGILAAGGDPPRLLTIDDDCIESPGFALPQKTALVTGKAAERRARLFPRQTLNRFWDPLSTDPLDPPLTLAGNQAEVACAHLGLVWSRVKPFGSALVVAVPASFQRTQMGLLLGMAQDLAVPLRGFVSLPVAAAGPGPEGVHLHVDAHLHRFEVSLLRAQSRLELTETVAVTEKGLDGLLKRWAQAAAAEFVRRTRFDPFHSAETEQELYDRLPAALAQLQAEPTTPLAIRAGRHQYGVTLTRALILETAKPVYDEWLTAVEDAVRRSVAPGRMTPLHASQRIVRLPGICERLRQIPGTRVVELPAGAAALALPGLWRELTEGRTAAAGAAFFNSRPWAAAGPPAVVERKAPALLPTHLLYRSLAYPLTPKPLVIGTAPPAAGRGIRIAADAADIEPAHCAVQIQEGKAVLTDLGSQTTLLNEQRVQTPVALMVGDTIRLGHTAQTLVAIACLDPHEA